MRASFQSQCWILIILRNLMINMVTKSEMRCCALSDSSTFKGNLKGKDFPLAIWVRVYCLTPNTKLDKAYIVAEQLRKNISEKGLK